MSFTVAPVTGLMTGTQIINGASIVFDQNAPIVTPTYLNTIDAGIPSSHVAAAVPATSCAKHRRACKTPLRTCKALKVSWSGSDAGAGVASFNVYAARNHGPFKLWRAATARLSDTYTVTPGSSYAFYTVATDGVGHVETTHKTAELRAKVSCARNRCALSTTSAVWDSLVRSTTLSGQQLTVTFNAGAARALHVTTLRLILDGQRKILTRKGHLPALVTIGAPPGNYVLSLRASTKSGQTTGLLSGKRTTSTCG